MREAGIRPPAVAGMFYPADPAELRAMITRQLDESELAPAAGAPVPVGLDGETDARRESESTEPPKAFIVPHAGYVYSGPVAASAYRLLVPVRDRIRRVVLIGPAHHVAVRGLALSGARGFATPLGTIPVDAESEAVLRGLPQVVVSEAAHAREHCLEVQLPFLQTVLESFVLVPLLTGDAGPDEVAEVLDTVWGGPETLILISSDLSHYLAYPAARELDGTTAQAIVELHTEGLAAGSACGRGAIRGLLEVARRRDLRARVIDLRSSGDTAGSHEAVVGYGSFAFG